MNMHSKVFKYQGFDHRRPDTEQVLLEMLIPLVDQLGAIAGCLCESAAYRYSGGDKVCDDSDENVMRVAELLKYHADLARSILTVRHVIVCKEAEKAAQAGDLPTNEAADIEEDC